MFLLRESGAAHTRDASIKMSQHREIRTPKDVSNQMPNIVRRRRPAGVEGGTTRTTGAAAALGGEGGESLPGPSDRHHLSHFSDLARDMSAYELLRHLRARKKEVRAISTSLVWVIVELFIICRSYRGAGAAGTGHVLRREQVVKIVNRLTDNGTRTLKAKQISANTYATSFVPCRCVRCETKKRKERKNLRERSDASKRYPCVRISA